MAESEHREGPHAYVVPPSRIGAKSGLTYGVRTPHPFDFSVTQVSFVVRDLDASIEAYRSAFGWGPFNVFDMGKDRKMFVVTQLNEEVEDPTPNDVYSIGVRELSSAC